MNCKWEVKTLGEIINLKRGYDLPASKREDGNIPIMASSGITGYHNEAKVNGPGVVTGRSGQLGKVFYIEEDYWALNTTLYVEDFKGNDPKYIYYLLQTLNFEQLNAGSSVPTLNRNHVHQLEVKIPLISIQKKIGNLLYQFEGKINMNDSSIKKMKQIAELLFKRWFIDFEFPNEQGLPYRSSGGEMVESELGEIPKGWEVEKLNYLAEIIMGQSPKGTSYNFEFEGLPLVNGASDFKGGEINPSKYTTEPKKISQKGDYIFGVRATLGNVTETQGEYAIGRGAGIARSRELKYKEYLYFQLVSAFNSFEHTASGSVYLNISKNDLNDYKIVVPTNRLLQKFHETTSAMLKKKEELIQENINLKTLRDTLLPKLLSGEIEIRDESVVEPS